MFSGSVLVKKSIPCGLQLVFCGVRSKAASQRSGFVVCCVRFGGVKSFEEVSFAWLDFFLKI